MFRVNYSHQWKISVPKESAWLLFSRAFENSLEVSEWPHSINDIFNQTGELTASAQLMTTYKVGPFKARAPYIIQQVIPEQRIIYDTAEDHPLHGQSQIELVDVIDGAVRSTEVRWSGFYEPKSFSSIPSMLFFKVFFERLFFLQLEHATKNAIRIKKTRHRVVIDKVA